MNTFSFRFSLEADPDENRCDDADHDAGYQTSQAQVHGSTVQLVDPDLGTCHGEQDRLEEHPEDLEGCCHWVLEQRGGCG